MSFRHDDNIEEIDYVDDSVDDDTSGFAANEDESDWDCSTMEIVALTPNKIQFPDGALPEYTPMSRKKQQQQAKEQQQQPKAGTFQQSISNILFSFQSPPPEQSKTKKPMYGDDNAAGFSVDSNRTKTPLYAVAVRTTGESFSDSSTVDDSSRDSYGRSMNYFPSKYLDKPSPQLSSQRYPQQRQVVPASPSTSMRYSGSPSSLQMQKQQQRSPFPQIPPSPAGSSQSSATFHSNYSQFSTDSRRQRSTMSYRSSTSMSLLHGEVINLEGSRILSDHSKYSASHTIIPDKIMPLQDIDDLEQGCLGPLEGLEIGGARSLSGLRSVPIVIGGGGGSSTRENRPTPLIALGIKSSKRLVSGIQHVQQLGRTTHKEIKKLGAATTAVTKRMLHYYRPPLSPRAQDLENLSYLQQAHKAKVGRLMENSLDLEDHYDFVLVLTPQEVYRYWADLLDFREEHLGVEGLVDPTIESSAYPITIESASTGSTDSTCDRSDPVVEEEEEARDFSTPLTGIYRRRGRTPSTKTLLQPHSEPRVSLATSLFSPEHPSTTKRLKSRLSMFEKAVGIIHSPNPTPRKLDDSEQEQDNFTPIQAKNNPTRPSTATTSVRRRWGNRTMNAQGGPNGSIANLFSPPVKSLTRGNASVVKTRVSSIPTAAKTTADALEDNTENCDPNRILKEEEIPNQVIPRGIAARTNGMLKFLSSLKRGIVVRRHRSNKDAVYCKIFSNDGGDTIQYQLVDTEEAMVAFKEQRVRYNRKVTHSSSPSSVRAISREWSCLDGPGDGSPVHKFKVPDHVAAQRYREKFSREHGVKKRLLDLATKAANSGMIRAADIVAVHPASHHDPRHPGVRKGELGTFTLRRSNSDQFTPNTFSIVTEVGQRFGGKAKTTGAAASDNKWYSGEGSELNFKTLDFEAATEGEYWLIFRGFLLLHRDAAVGRFAAKRKAGIGGGTLRNREDGEECDQLENQLQRDVFKEPVTVGCLERLVVKYRKLDDSYFKGEVLNSAVPPPSDYFLGFKSPGTQIWSRLRLAGLETQRVYAVDTRRVMIKIRCPEDRLTDLAEVLRLKMKTIDGAFAPFREDSAEMFRSKNDDLDIPSLYHGKMAALLLSKQRQTIIDFIIGSRIRDSGAELGQTTDVGKMIQARVPLHMPQKLESLFKVWVTFWRHENWGGKDGKDLDSDVAEADFQCEETSQQSREDNHIPSFFSRLLMGAFHQPLDFIERYFGEQVTFYFAWLQHCANHLLVLTFFGLIVTICQLSTDNFDHPLRPFFSMFVMIWTFFVLVNWRKRSNFLAHRWGSMDYKVQETPRPEFHGEYVVDEITQEWVVKYPKWKRWLKYLISIPICVTFTGTVLLLILLVHANRDLQMESYVTQLTDPNAEPFKFELSLKNIGQKASIEKIPLTRDLLFDPTFWVVMGALPALLGLCIPIMNLILMRIAVVLNNFENYRTESEYRTHLIIKVFSFRFVSQFGTLYYYAWLSRGSTPAIENGIIRMGTSLMIYTTVAHWWQIFLQVYFFMFIRNIRRFLYRRNLRKELRNIELEEAEITTELSDAEARQIRLINKRMLLDQAQDDVWFEIMNPPHDSFPEYITAVVQFSFVACFSVVLPITPLFCLFNYLLSMRYDAYKLCRGRRRPFAKQTGGIGVWEHLLHIVAVVAVLTNCWLMGFTNSNFTWLEEEIGTIGLFGVVVAWEHIMLLIKYVMQTSISPLPRSVRDEIKREQHRLEQQRYSTMRLKDRRTQRSRSNRSLANLAATYLESPKKNDDEHLVMMTTTPESTIPSSDEEAGNRLFSC